MRNYILYTQICRKLYGRCHYFVPAKGDGVHKRFYLLLKQPTTQHILPGIT